MHGSGKHLLVLRTWEGHESASILFCNNLARPSRKSQLLDLTHKCVSQRKRSIISSGKGGPWAQKTRQFTRAWLLECLAGNSPSAPGEAQEPGRVLLLLTGGSRGVVPPAPSPPSFPSPALSPAQSCIPSKKPAAVSLQ